MASKHPQNPALSPSWFSPIKGVVIYTELVAMVVKKYKLSQDQSAALTQLVIKSILNDPSSITHLHLCHPLTGALIKSAPPSGIPLIGTSLEEFDRWLGASKLVHWRISPKRKKAAALAQTATVSNASKKKALIVIYGSFWHNIVSDFSNSSRNGLSAAGRVEGGWDEARVIGWAIRRGRLTHASPADIADLQTRLKL